MKKLETALLKILEDNPYRTYKPKELARLLSVPTVQYKDFRKFLKKLVSEGKINRYKKNRLGMGRPSREMTGHLHVKSQGYGFLIQDDANEDIFISHLNMGTALNGDLVKVQLFAEQRGKSLEGKVVEVLDRAHKNIVGIYHADKYWGFVVADDMKIQRDIYIPNERKHGAKNGQKVVVRLDAWEDEHLNPEGEIIEILGFPNEPGVDIISIAKSMDLATTFPDNIIKEVNQIPDAIPQSEIHRRVDLRDDEIFTIDPEDSKDFDDAVSLKILDNGNYLLGVHIADVSYYVGDNTSLDTDALHRGTSIYLVDQVIPMLPEKLSSDLCSLKEGVDRLSFSVNMELTDEGHIVNYKIYESVIHSKKRFTYEDVQHIIDDPDKSNGFAPTIERMFKLSQILIARRGERGGLEFGSNEVTIKLDDKGVPVRIDRRVQLDSHRIVEEFMVLANSTVASHIAYTLRSKIDNLLPFVFRIHEKPSHDKLRDFNLFLNALGFHYELKKRVTPKTFQSILNDITDDDRKALVQEVMVRTMMKARYNINNSGHFGLALKNYCHFTSPIRRYPDLICHRLLKGYLNEPAKSQIKRNRLKRICEIATDREIKAQEAERASIKVKQLEFMEQYIGEIFEGIISGVVAFGLFVEITAYLVEGLVHIKNLPDDYYIHDEVRYCLYGQYHGKEYRLGDHVKILVAQVNREAQLIDFELVE